MKVLQVNCVYKKGSTGKITYDIHTELLKQGIESVVCYGRGENVQDKFVYKTCGELYSKVNHLFSKITGVMYGGCFFSTRKLISIIQNEEPDIVHLQCLNGYFVNIYRLINWLKVNRIRTVVTLHAEFMYTGGCGYSIDCNQWSTCEGCGHFTKCPRWRAETGALFFDRTETMWKRMKQAFNGFDDRLIVTSVSPWLMERAKISPILEGKRHCVVLNGVDSEHIFHSYGELSAANLKKELGIENEMVIFHVSPFFNDNPNHIKGGYYVIELAKRMPEVKFVVAGTVSKGINVPPNMILLGLVTDQNRLAQLYSMADVTILTSKRETFSMVTAESLCCGTPVVGFKAGAPEMIALSEYSEFVEHGDLEALKSAVSRQIVNQKQIDRKLTYVYSREHMKNGYISLYNSFFND